jgi:hypothetical protein
VLYALAIGPLVQRALPPFDRAAPLSRAQT